jgi:hypothetical protein
MPIVLKPVEYSIHCTHTHACGERECEREREYPNNALEAKGVPADMAAAAAEAAAVAENNP